MRFLFSGVTTLVVGATVLGACGSSNDGGTTSSSATDAGTTSSSGTPGTGTGTGTTAIVTKTTESMTVNGQSRVYILKVPTNLDKTKAYPLVMDLHGSPGDAAGQSGDGFENASGQSAIIVDPQALNEDSGAFSWDLGDAAAQNADIAMLEALPGELKTAKGLNVDTTKVFGYGYSGGAFFLQVYQCLGVKVYRAISSNAGGSPDSLRSTLGPKNHDICFSCPGTAVPELIVFGALDESQGGDFQAMCAAQQAGCGDTRTDTAPSPCQQYDGCPADKPVTYCNVAGVGHNPGWSEAISTSWGFFKAYL